MQAVGMIAEFNPLHNGHVYAMRQARQLSKADVVVVLMAGNYVQRGEPAVVDKWARAKAALASGADLVVEPAGPPTAV
ncbi:nucleotidyltransferase family protein, partial [Lacticaseibacillus camelliae]|uniref:nucleotidyltransferase family protein n=1 Tax=Lacticaseibacillus camelliae TaxID=381742 RepID=UPI0012E265F2